MGVAKTGNRLSFGPVLRNNSGSCLVSISSFDDLFKMTPNDLHDSAELAAHTQDAGSNRALNRIGRSHVHHARAHRRHDTVVHQRDQRRVQHPGLLRCWQSSQNVKVNHLGKIHLANQVVHQAFAAYGRALCVKSRNAG